MANTNIAENKSDSMDDIVETAESIKNRFKQAEDKVRSSLQDLKSTLGIEHVKRQVRAHPIEAVLISAAAGVALAWNMRPAHSLDGKSYSGRGRLREDWTSLKRLALMQGYEWLLRTVVREFPRLSEHAEGLKENHRTRREEDGSGCRSAANG